MTSLFEKIKLLYHKLGSPRYFYELSSYWIFPLAVSCFVLLLVGGVGGLAMAPADYQQGDVFRVIYVHVPSAILSQSAYMLIAVCGFITLVWRMKMAAMVARASMLLGASFALLTLLTGAIWGKPTWGTWWLWGDARLMSSLLLLFLYMGMISLRESFSDEQSGIRASSFLAIIGLVNIPVIKYSVLWWNSLHQPATIKLTEKPAMQMEMFWPLMVMILAFYCFFALMLILRVRNEILQSESNSKWLREALAEELK